MRVLAGNTVDTRTNDAIASGELAITHEDLARARDRDRVAAARRKGGPASQLRLMWLLLGPGILVMLGENDGSSMLSYAATGTRFGIGFFLPFIALTFVMATIVQEMTVRLGAVTHRGHAELIFARFGPFWGWFSMIDLAIGNFLTLITEFIAIRAGLGFLGVKPWIAVSCAVMLLYFAILTRRYWTWERITLAIAAFNLVFVPLALMSRPDWTSIGRSFVHWTPLPGGTNETLFMILSTIGATVTPWMLFFQQSATADKGLTRRDIKFGRMDTLLGATLAATAALAMVVVTAPLFARHMGPQNFQAAEFAQALQPVIGRFGSILFSLGMVEAGMVAAITISASSAYAFGEVAGTPHSLNLTLREGKAFYSVLFLCVALAAGMSLIPGLPLVHVVMTVNLVAVLAMPPALVFLFLLANDKEIMGDLVSPRWANMLTAAIVVLLTTAGVLFGISVVAPKAFIALAGHP